MCLSVIYLDSFILYDDNLKSPSFNLYREDYPDKMQEQTNFKIKIKD